MTQNMKSVMKSGNTGGYTPTPGHEEGPGYPMSKHGAQDAMNGGRQGGRQSGSSHATEGRSETYESDTMDTGKE